MEYVFGYGSLIWKPPPHTVERIPGYIKGFSRRFAQLSHDHRGTPESPGRVATLVTAADWHALPNADNLTDGDLVWGVCYRIDPNYAQEVKDYLDHREKDGFSCQEVDVWGPGENGKDTVLVHKAQTYVGLSDNPSFAGAEPLDRVAEIIAWNIGPSGPNSEYLLELHKAVAEISPESRDAYLDELADRVTRLLSAETLKN